MIKKFYKLVLSRKRKYQLDERIILRDFLAMERTRLANERTLLAYISSFLYLLLGGIAFLQLEGFDNIKWFGYVALAMSVVFLVLGIFRFFQLRSSLKDFYQKMEDLRNSDE